MFCGVVPKLTQGRNIREVGGEVNFFPDTGVHYLLREKPGPIASKQAGAECFQVPDSPWH